MIIPINKNLVFKNIKPFQIKRDKIIKCNINNYWREFIKKNNGYFNGDIYVVSNFNETIDSYTFEIGKTKYADLIYAKEISNITCNSLFSSCIFITSDNYYVLIKNNHDKLNIIGGMADRDDFINNKFSFYHCIKRELKEELNIDIDDKSIILNYCPKYIKIPTLDEAMCPVGVIYVCNLNITRKDLEKYYNKNIKNFDHEIKELVFCTKDNYLDFKDMEHKEAYFIELIKLIKKEKK